MAEQVARVRLQAIVDGLEGFDQLIGAFKGLQRAIGPADQELDRARRQLNEFARASQQSEQLLRGQIDALRALQSQATIGGSTYRRLGDDIAQLGKAYREAASGVRELTDAQKRTQFVGAKQSTFGSQIAGLKRELAELSVYQREYANKLTEIKRRQLPFNTAVGRQNVIADFETYRQGGLNSGQTLPAMPDTTAALNQRLGELNKELANVTRGGTDWLRVSREIVAVQRQLNQEFANPAVEAARQRLEASRNTSSGFLAFSSGLEERLAIQKSIERNQRRVAEAQRRSAERPMYEISGLYETIGQVGMSNVNRQSQFMGNSATKVYEDIVRSFNASTKAVGSNVTDTLANELNQGSSEVAKASDNLADKMIDAVKRRLGIASPSKVFIEIGKQIVQGLIQGIRSGQDAVKVGVGDLLGQVGRAPLPGQLGETSETGRRVAAFIGRSSARPSFYRRLANLAGDEILQSPAVTLATYRGAYEKGGIVPSMYLPTEARRGLRGTPGIPGAGLEQEIIKAAMGAVSRTGTLFGPIKGPVTLNVKPSDLSSPYGTGATGTLGGRMLPVFRPRVSGSFTPGEGTFNFAGGGASVPATPVPRITPLFRTSVVSGFQSSGSFNFSGPSQQQLAAIMAGAPGARSIFQASGQSQLASTASKSVFSLVEGIKGAVNDSVKQAEAEIQRSSTASDSKLKQVVQAGTALVDRISSSATQAIQRASQSVGGQSTRIGRAISRLSETPEMENRRLTREELSARYRTGFTAFSQRATEITQGAGGGGVGGGGGRGRGGSGSAGAAGAAAGVAAAAATLPDFGPFRNASIRQLQDVRSALEQFRQELSPLDGDFKRLERAATGSLGKIDKELERRQGGGLRGKIGYIGQGIGAAASAGIFGGPEGAIGGLGGGAIGAMLGGPAGFAAGSFIGSSVGAYAGMARQQIGGFSTYAADIQKLEIALKGVTKTQEQYQRALAASASVTRDFNVPQLEATRGMTQLSAAVIGAGGKVADAEVVFRNVTAAIKASGGSAEDVQGALTALGQIFSKGKVSAEELQGQLGERLPGAVTMFARATGRTLPQLQKDLEQGVVGLADLMKFVVSDQGLGGFEQKAKDIADSSADAGARLTATWNDTRRAIGEALLPLGAEIQNSLGEALRAATPALVELAKGLAGFVKLLVDNAGAIAAIGRFVLTFGGATLAVQAFTALIFPLQQGLALLAAAFGTTTAQSIVAQNRLISFGATLKTLGKAVAAPLVVTVAIVGAQLVIDWFNRIKAAKDNLTRTTSAATGGEWLSDIGGNALDRQRLTGALSEVGKAYGEATDKVIRLRKERDRLEKEGPRALGSNAIRAAAQLTEVRSQLALAEAQQKLLESRYRAGINRLPNAPNAAGPSGLTDFSAPADETGGDKAREKAQREAEAAAAEQQRLNESLAKAKIALDDAVFRNQMELVRKRYEYENELINKQRDNWVNSQTGAAKTVAGLVSRFLGDIDQMQQRMFDARQGVTSAAQELASRSAMAAVTVQSSSPMSGRYIQGSIGPTSTGPHFDIKRSDYGYFDRAALDAYVRVNGAPLSSGITRPGGRFGAQRSYGSHAGWDYAFGNGAALTLTGGAQWMGTRPGTSNGDETAFMTPDGKVYKILHGRFQGSGGGAEARRDVAAEGSADVAQAGLQQSQELLKLYNEQMAKMTPEVVKSFVLSLTGDLREQNAALRDSAEVMALRNRLEAEGVRPEVIDFRVKETEATQKNNQALKVLETLLAAAKAKVDALTAAKKTDTDEYRTAQTQVAGYTQGIAELNTNFAENIKLTREATAAQIAFNDSMRFRQDNRIGMGLKEGAQQYVESIGTMREATAQLAQTGIKGVEDAIFSLVTTGKVNFQEFALEIINQTTQMVIQQLILRSIMQAIGFLNPSTGNAANTIGALVNPATAANGAVVHNGIQPFAMGGIVTRPTMFRYANGGVPGLGLMGEAGPEAIIPLRRGRDGKLGVVGGGNTTSVTVNVDASGSQVQGNGGQGEALGRAVSQAVQAEILKQRRPGGLLAA